MSRRSVLLAALVCAALRAGALDWPLEPGILLGTFASSEAGAFAAGIDLAGAGKPVWPVADGEVIFSYREGDYSSLPRGSGNMVALLHESGIESVYSHLAALDNLGPRVRARPRQLTPAELEAVLGELGDEDSRALVRASYERRGDRFLLRSDLDPSTQSALWDALAGTSTFAPLGVVGDTGAVDGPKLTLMILDARERRFLNPIKPDKPPLQPPPSATGSLPVIEQVLLEREGDRTELSDGMVVAAGAAEVLVVAYDMVSHGRVAYRVAPYRLSLAQSGEIVREIKLDGLLESGGRLQVAGAGANARYEDLYAGRWTYRLGKVSLREGQTRLQVRVEGLGGASRTVDLRLLVRP